MSNPTGDALAAQAQSIVTEEMVEAAKHAVWNTDAPVYARDYMQYDAIMRAAINAVLPLIGEALAKVADQRSNYEATRNCSAAETACEIIATTIRNLTKAKP